MLVHTHGEVTILRNGEEITTSDLQSEDEIRTGDDGWAEIAFLDGTIIRIDSNARFSLSEVEEGFYKGEIFWGRIWGLIPHGKPCRIDIPGSAVIAVRGTEFTVGVAEDGTTTLTVLEGTVEFSDLAQTENVLVGQYQTSVVTPGGAPSNPVSIDPAEIDRWWEWEGEGTTPGGAPPAFPWVIVMVLILIAMVVAGAVYAFG